MAKCLTPDGTSYKGLPVYLIRLADGNCWGLALPTTRLSSTLARSVDDFGRAREVVTVHESFGHPASVKRLLLALRTASESGSSEEQYDTFLALAAKLLQLAHDLDNGSALDLLTVSDAELPALVNAVVTVAMDEEVHTSNTSHGEPTR